jgi:hypothetical protein
MVERSDIHLLKEALVETPIVRAQLGKPFNAAGFQGCYSASAS